MCQWAFIPSHSSYENYDNLFLLSIRNPLLPDLCQIILHGTAIPTCALCYSQLWFWQPFSRLKGISNGFCVNPRQWISQKSDDSISRVGWLDSPWRLQNFNVIRSNTDVLRHVCSLANRMVLLPLTYLPSNVLFFATLNSHFWTCHLYKNNNYRSYITMLKMDKWNNDAWKCQF